MLDKLNKADFSQHINESFRIFNEPFGQVDSKLIEVSCLGNGSPEDKGEEERSSFSIVFLGPNEPVLTQRIYPIEHDVMGHLDLFLVPIGPNADGMRYEAVFA